MDRWGSTNTGSARWKDPLGSSLSTNAITSSNYRRSSLISEQQHPYQQAPLYHQQEGDPFQSRNPSFRDITLSTSGNNSSHAVVNVLNHSSNNTNVLKSKSNETPVGISGGSQWFRESTTPTLLSTASNIYRPEKKLNNSNSNSSSNNNSAYTAQYHHQHSLEQRTESSDWQKLVQSAMTKEEPRRDSFTGGPINKPYTGATGNTAGASSNPIPGSNKSLNSNIAGSSDSGYLSGNNNTNNSNNNKVIPSASSPPPQPQQEHPITTLEPSSSNSRNKDRERDSNVTGSANTNNPALQTPTSSSTKAVASTPAFAGTALRATPRLPPNYWGPEPPIPLDNLERAVKWHFDPLDSKWASTLIVVKVDKRPFAEGAMRFAFKLLDLSEPIEDREYVMKMPKVNSQQEEETLWEDAQVQSVAKLWAHKFNEDARVPKKIDFLVCFVLQLIDRPGEPLVTLERFVKGEYIKWSNNWEFTDERRNTPHAFSHFTYEASGHRLVVCDVQGVGDMYTDPQIHSVDGSFGNGNLGATGIGAFCRGHKCNALCRALELPPLGEKYKADDQGTCAAEPKKVYKSPIIRPYSDPLERATPGQISLPIQQQMHDIPQQRPPTQIQAPVQAQQQQQQQQPQPVQLSQQQPQQQQMSYLQQYNRETNARPSSYDLKQQPSYDLKHQPSYDLKQQPSSNISGRPFNEIHSSSSPLGASDNRLVSRAHVSRTPKYRSESAAAFENRSSAYDNRATPYTRSNAVNGRADSYVAYYNDNASSPFLRTAASQQPLQQPLYQNAHSRAEDWRSIRS